MCGRARLSSDVSEIKLVFSIPPGRSTPNIAPSWNVAPTDPLPVVHYDADAGESSLDVMRWGLIPFWAKDIKIGFSTFNARAEEIERKPAFRDAFKRRRCLVPLDNFYEWVRREVACVIVRRRHPAGPAVPSAVPYEVGRVGNNPSKYKSFAVFFCDLSAAANHFTPSVSNAAASSGPWRSMAWFPSRPRS
jgi:hypothetical protein